jgi:hypothetical protein
MPDEPLYDPDRTVPEDLNFTDPDVASAYLNHPVTQDLHADLGRLFQDLPAESQQRMLGEYVADLVAERTQAAADIEGLDHCAPAVPLLEQFLADLDENIEAAKSRMLELD